MGAFACPEPDDDDLCDDQQEDRLAQRGNDGEEREANEPRRCTRTRDRSFA